MPVLEIDKIGDKIVTPTQTEPRLSLSPRVSRIAGLIQDPSITVIENPINGGRIGYLFAERYSENRHLRVFRDIRRFRYDRGLARLVGSERYRAVTIEKGFDNGQVYEFMLGESKVLPTPTLVPYEICFFKPDEYDRYLNSLLRAKKVVDIVTELDFLLAARVGRFYLDDMSMLKLPDNYATFTLGKKG